MSWAASRKALLAGQGRGTFLLLGTGEAASEVLGPVLGLPSVREAEMYWGDSSNGPQR